MEKKHCEEVEMAAQSEGFASSSPPSTFQLQTSTIRNSAPFKTKSADVFGSLDTMERDYNSTVNKRGMDVGGAKADDEGEAEEGYIKRGCIFRKPQGSLGHKNGSAIASSATSTAGSLSSEVPRGDKASSHIAKTPDKHPSESPETLASARDATSVGSRDKSSFRKPDCRTRTNVDRRGRATTNPRGRRGPADHVLNPHKYTKYSLEETNMCGNTANRSVALGFLSELRRRKEQGDNQAVQESGTEDQIIFHKPRDTRSHEQVEQPAKRSYGSVYKMPEYEVGQAPTPANKKRKISPFGETSVTVVDEDVPKISSRPVISLDHFESQHSLDKDSGMTQGVNQSEWSNLSTPVDTDESEQTVVSHHEEGTFKSKKGKGKRHLRSRQENT